MPLLIQTLYPHPWRFPHGHGAQGDREAHQAADGVAAVLSVFQDDGLDAAAFEMSELLLDLIEQDFELEINGGHGVLLTRLRPNCAGSRR